MKILPKCVGVLGFLGPFTRHANILKRLNVIVTYVKNPEDLEAVDALIIPGTEITSLKAALKNLLPFIKARLEGGMPLLLTGEATLLISREERTEISCKQVFIQTYSEGYQKRFNEDVILSFSDSRDFPGVFVKPSKIKIVSSPFNVIGVRKSDGEDPVILEYKNILACTFYPEFTRDYRIHEYFLTKI